MASQSRLFSLIGDSNVRAHMNPTNTRDRPLMSSAQVMICTKAAIFHQTLRSIRSESNVCVISCITNFLSDSPPISSTVSLRVGPVIDEFFSRIVESCEANPTRKYLVCPPMYRSTPLWLRDNMSEVMTRFSTSYGREAVKVTNLHALPGFPSPSYESDGLHLTAYSGFEFVLHLFDSAKVTLDTLDVSSEVKQAHSCEATRALGDRVIALEQDHRRLTSALDLKTAIDAELACFRSNERSEDSFIISGLRKIRDGLSGRDWQEEAKKEVKRVVSQFFEKEFRIIVVHNVTGRGSSSPVSFSVKLDSVNDSRLIRSKFSAFFQGGSDNRPRPLSDVTIRNVLTKETRIRISIMKALGKRYEESNQGSSFQVIGFDPRPLLKITPPKGASDRRIKTFTFIEAVQRLKVALSDKDLEIISKQIGTKFNGRLRSLFVVLDDDQMRDARTKSRANKRGHVDEDDSEDPPSQRTKE